jgi:membrane fusion protein, multidrug efflux system
MNIAPFSVLAPHDSDQVTKSEHPPLSIPLDLAAATIAQPGQSQIVVQSPSNHPIAAAQPQTASLVEPQPLNLASRWLKGTCAMTLGLVAVGLGGSSLSYRLTHLQAEGGVVSGRLVTLQAPQTGMLQNFYARTGVAVKQGQVLAQVAIAAPEANGPESNSVQAELQTRLQSLTMEHQQAQQMLKLLQSQHAQSTQRIQSWQQAQVLAMAASHPASSTVSPTVSPTTSPTVPRAPASDRAQFEIRRQQSLINRWTAAVRAQQAQAEAARLEHERYRDLWQQGVIALQKVESLKAEWIAAQAKVEEAQANLEEARLELGQLQAARQASRQASLQAPLQASHQPSLQARATPASPLPLSLAQPQGFTSADIKDWLKVQESLQQSEQAIQTQTAKVASLHSQLQQVQQRLQKMQVSQSKPQVLDVRAPFAGVVYRTERDWGEQVNRPDRLLTLIDCQDLWTEVFVTANQASQIQSQQAVRVQLAGSNKTLLGKVERMESVSRLEQLRARTPGPLPTVTLSMERHPLTRVIVRLPSLPNQGNSQQLCSIGQAATLTFAQQSWLPSWPWQQSAEPKPPQLPAAQLPAA